MHRQFQICRNIYILFELNFFCGVNVLIGFSYRRFSEMYFGPYVVLSMTVPVTLTQIRK
jgi:hypothetical protein